MRSLGRCVRHFGASPTGLWLIKHVVSPIDRLVVRVSGGRIPPPSRLVVPSLLLTVAGAKTGRERTVPLVYLRDGPRLVVANARPSGERRNPWVVNLRASGRAQIQVGRSTLEVTAREIAHPEVPRYWPALTAAWPSFAEAYAATGERTLFALEPIDPGNVRPPDDDRPSARTARGQRKSQPADWTG